MRRTSKQKLAEQALRESEARYRIVAETAADGIVTINQDSRILFVNLAMEKIFGYSASEMIGEQLTMLMPEAFRDRHTQSLKRYLQTGVKHLSWKGIELQGRHKSGQQIPLEISFGESVTGEQHLFTGIVRDVTERKRVEEELRNSEQKYRHLFDQSPWPMWILDEETLQFLDINQAAIEDYGYSREEFLNMTLKDIRPPEDVPALLSSLSAARASKTQRRFNAGVVRHRKKDGTIIYIEVASGLVSYGERKARLALMHNVTLRKQTEDTVAKLSRAVEQTDDQVFITDKEGRMEYVNPAFEQFTGYTKEEVLGQTPRILKSGRHNKPFYEKLWETILAGEVFRATFINRKKNGGLYYLEQNITPLKDPNGQITHFVSTGKDITDQHLAEKARRVSESRFQRLFESNIIGIIITDLYGNITEANNSFLEITGYDIEDLPLKSHKVTPVDYLPADKQAMRDLLTLGSASPREKEFVCKDGSRISVLEGISVLDEANDSCIAFVLDITERKRMDEALRSSETKYHSLFEESKDVVFISSREGNIIDINPAGVELLGCSSKEEALQINVVEDLAWDLENLNAYRQILKKDGYVKDFELSLKKRNGQKLTLLVSSTAVRDQAGHIAQVRSIARDITQRRQREERQSAQHAVTRVLAESVTLEEGAPRILQVLCETLDWEAGSLLIPGTEDNVLRCVSTWSLSNSNVENFEVMTKQMSCADSIGFPGIEWATDQTVWFPDVLQYERFAQSPLARSLGVRSAFAFPIRIMNKIGGVIEFFSRTVRDPDDDLVEMMSALGSQIGQFMERKRSENDKAELERRLLQAQKMEAIGQLAGGVAHDFNNTLMAISGYSELLSTLIPEDSPVRPYVSELLKASQQGGRLTRQLLAFSRRQVLVPKALDLNQSITEMEDMLRRLIGEDIELQVIQAKNLGTVEADPGQIQQVLMNLLVNARDAMPNGGKVIIETANAVLDEEYAGSHPGAKAGPYVLMAIKDTGQGMDETTMGRIFEPFFTTKEEGKGTGLGLSTVYGIVKQSGGYITVHSQVSQGTTVKIYLPRVDQPTRDGSPAQSEARREPDRKGNQEIILLVDDNESVRTAIGSFLKLKGFHVVQAGSGPDALRAIQTQEFPIDLLVTDVVMPGMSGTELFQNLQGSFPTLKVLYLSGYTEEAIRSDGLLSTNSSFLSKPVTLKNLMTKILELLA